MIKMPIQGEVVIRPEPCVNIRPESCVAIRLITRKFFKFEFENFLDSAIGHFCGFDYYKSNHSKIRIILKHFSRKFQFEIKFSNFCKRAIFADLTFIRPITRKFMK